MTAMSRGSPSSAVCRARSFMTTPGLRWPASSVTASVSGHVCSASYDPITCSRTALAAPARGTTRARSRGSSAIAAGTSWCRCQGSGTSMISTRILKPAVPSDGRNNCVATTRRSANAWNGIVRFFSAFPQSPTTPATSARGGSVRCRWCAIAAPITPSPHGSAIARCWSAAMSHEVVISCAAEVIARHPRSYEQEDFVFDPLHYLSLLEQKTNALDQAAPLGRLAVAAGVRRSPPPT